jgi:hypothetical protein
MHSPTVPSWNNVCFSYLTGNFSMTWNNNEQIQHFTSRNSNQLPPKSNVLDTILYALVSNRYQIRIFDSVFNFATKTLIGIEICMWVWSRGDRYIIHDSNGGSVVSQCFLECRGPSLTDCRRCSLGTREFLRLRYTEQCTKHAAPLTSECYRM